MAQWMNGWMNYAMVVWNRYVIYGAEQIFQPDLCGDDPVLLEFINQSLGNDWQVNQNN